LIASSESQRQIVDAEASQTARSITSRCSSVRVKRDSGSPTVAGSSQAIALTSATCSGGKTARATRARPVPEPVEAILKKAPSPLPHDPRRGVKPNGDLGVGQPVGGIERDARALDLAPRPLLSASDALQL
jgi:hypothetical protein